MPTVLTVAGSDSGGAAGIQADLKALAAAGVHGMTAVTALTAQSTVEVTGIHAVPPAFVLEQVRTVLDDLGVDAVKTGMLGSAQTVLAVEAALGLLAPGTPVVVDPVMVAESGATLLDAEASAAVVERLLPLATVVTPNLPEARALARTAGLDVAGADDDPAAVEALARALHGLGPAVVVITGGHREVLEDVVYDGTELHRLAGERHPGGATHGSGCTHASTLAARLALGDDPLEAAVAARAAAARAVRDGLRGLGAGQGPVDVLGVAARARQSARHPPEPATDLS